MITLSLLCIGMVLLYCLLLDVVFSFFCVGCLLGFWFSLLWLCLTMLLFCFNSVVCMHLFDCSLLLVLNY